MDPTFCACQDGGDSGQQCCSTGDGSTSCPPPESSSAYSANPVRYLNGEIRLIVQDLSSNGFGEPWGHTRSYSNRLTVQDQGVNGSSWFVKELPQLVQVSSTQICLIQITNDALWFNWDTSRWAPEFYVQDTLAQDTGNSQFIYTDTSGRIIKFHDFGTGQGAKAGQLKSFTDRAGNETVATYVSDKIASFVQISGSKQTGYYYDYIPSGQSNAGKLQYVTLRVDGSTDAANVRRAKYDYHAGSDSFGLAGDLKRVTIQEWKDSAWVTSGTTYYRYYLGTEANGIAHGLKYVLGRFGYAQMVAWGITPETAYDWQIAINADHYFEYNPSSKEVTLEKVGGGTMAFSNSRTTSSHADDFNNWKTKSVEMLPDGNKRIVYTNHVAQPILKVFVKMVNGQETNDKWYDYFRYDSAGRLLQHAASSAVQSYAESSPTLVTLNASTGLIRVYAYYSSTDLTNGAVAGYLRYEGVQQGGGGSVIKVKERKYTSRTAAGATIYPLWKEICYPSATDQTVQLECTIYSYTWQGNFQVDQRTTTLPAVGASQNGSGNADSLVEVFDQFGRVVWLKDERGFLSRSKYDDSSGGMVQRIDDVQVSQITDSPAVPSGWTTPSGGGLHLVTDYTLDQRGRVTQELGPSHAVALDSTSTTIRRARWVVYRDDIHEQWEGVGYATGTAPNYSYTLINPVKVTKRDSIGRVTDTIQAKRSSTAGKLAATDAFPQSGWVRWTRNAYDNNQNLAWQRVYVAIPASGAGSPGTNYNETRYGYDSHKRQNRAQTPGGTITRTVYHARGWVQETWIGTNDTGATESDPSGGGTTGNKMVKVDAREYDGNVAGGDGNLTKLTRYENATTTRVTSFLYDFRNRRTDEDGEIDFYETYTYDNLDRLIQTDRWDTSPTPSSKLRARSQTNYDSRGRVYQRVRYAVDQSDGTPGNSLTDNLWYDPAGNLIKDRLQRPQRSVSDHRSQGDHHPVQLRRCRAENQGDRKLRQGRDGARPEPGDGLRLQC